MAEDMLWSAIRQQDIPAFTELYRTFYPFLFSYGIRVSGDKDIVKDAIHELFMELWRSRDSLPEVHHVGFYLRTILRRKLLRTVPQRQWRTLQEDDGTELSYEELLVRMQGDEEMKDKVARAVQTLTKKQMEVIRLRFFDDRSYAEIAHLTATTPRTVYNQVYEALKTLKKFF